MIGLLILICFLLGYICAELTKIHQHFHSLEERISDVTTYDYRHLPMIRTTEEP